MAVFSIRQLIDGVPEVIKNIPIINISTEPIKLRPGNTVTVTLSGALLVPDRFSSSIPMHEVRMKAQLPECQRMTRDQDATFRNYDGHAAKYCQILIFSLRPPELFHLFSNPIEYFRYCHIGDSEVDSDIAHKLLHPYDSEDEPDGFMYSHWIDQLGRIVKIRSLAFK